MPPESKGFIGERFDADAGLQYLNARYYDPKMAMFLQPDWWEVTEPGVGTNRYGYARNDPVNFRDSGGNCFWDVCVGEGAFLSVLGAFLASVFAADTAIDISNGGNLGDSPLGNPLGVATATVLGTGSAVLNTESDDQNSDGNGLISDGSTTAQTAGGGCEPEDCEDEPSSLNESDIEHIFGRNNIKRHNLEELLDAFGGDQDAAARAIEKSVLKVAKASADSSGIFRGVTVSIRGYNVVVVGKIVNGVVRIGTAYIP